MIYFHIEITNFFSLQCLRVALQHHLALFCPGEAVSPRYALTTSPDPRVSEFTRRGDRTCVQRMREQHITSSLFILLGLNHNAGSEIGCERPRYKAAQPSLSQITRDCSTLQHSKFKEVWALINLFPLCFPIAFVGGKKKELYLKEISMSPGEIVCFKQGVYHVLGSLFLPNNNV